jgi:hypothetical protein
VGYFKRKLDRGRSRRLVRALNDAAVDGKPWQAIPDGPPPAPGFVRFSVPDLHEESGRRRGIFAVAYDLLESAHTDPLHAQAIDDALDWFERELPVPDLRNKRAIFLFKTEASACMEHIWTLTHALREAGVWVEMQSFSRPGRIVYRDEQQVAVLPWADATGL